MDASPIKRSHKLYLSPHAIGSTISRDLTEGKKAKEEENLTAWQENTNRRRVGLSSHASEIFKSEDELENEDGNEDKLSSASEEEAESIASLESDNLDRKNAEIENSAGILWRVDTLRRHAGRDGLRDEDMSSDNRKNNATYKISALPSKANGNDRQNPSPSEREKKNPSNILFSDKTPGSEGISKADRDPAIALARRASGELGLNLFENSDLSKFFSNLLDTVSKQSQQTLYLESKVRELELQLDHSHKFHDPDARDKLETHKPNTPNTATYQILHTIACDARNHKHGSGLFLDKPSRRGSELNGNNCVWDIHAYLLDNPNFAFVVIRNYECYESSPLKATRFRKSKSENIDPGQISPNYETIHICSDSLRSAFNEVGNCTPFEVGSYGMISPYLYVYHHRKQLQKLVEERQGELSQHLQSLIAYIESQYNEEYDDADVKFARGIVTLEHLSKLFVPNEVLVCNEKGHRMAYVLGKWPARYAVDVGGSNSLEFQCWSWAYDGDELYRIDESKSVSLSSHEEIKIDQLRAYPLKYATRELQNQLRNRGLKFWNFRRQHLVVYSGPDFYKENNYDHNRFMIDPATYSKLHQGYRKRPPLDNTDRFDCWPETIQLDRQVLSDAELTILPPTVHGFDFQEKEWIRLNIDLIESITWNKGAFQRLVLPSKTKELIQALVTTRISGMQDIISNKGNGLVILLHGGPGTGKTLTAETVAEIAEKPLYRVTCGDIGTNTEEVEKYLSSIFSLGKIWGSVLLLDEADIFLEERSRADLQRNRLVSIFLRIVEYYDGILILTSNRVGTFDAAFKSRIQVSIHYSNLSKLSRKKIWRNFLDMLENLDEEVDIAELEQHLDDLAEDNLNGRQIRNCVTTARGLAAFGKQKLGWKHFEQAIRTASEFQSYLDDVHSGLTEDEMAREDGLR